MSRHAFALAASGAAVAFLTAGCVANSGSGAGVTIDVSSGDKTCELSAVSAPAGQLTFRVKNTGGNSTEFYLYGTDGKQVVGEVEDIGPGVTRDLSVTLEPGRYVTACKPGMTGEGIRADFTVSETASTSGAPASAPAVATP